MEDLSSLSVLFNYTFPQLKDNLHTNEKISSPKVEGFTLIPYYQIAGSENVKINNFSIKAHYYVVLSVYCVHS